MKSYKRYPPEPPSGPHRVVGLLLVVLMALLLISSMLNLVRMAL